MVETIGIRTRFTAAACGALMATFVAVPKVAAERPTDKDVKQLLERVDNDRDRFEASVKAADGLKEDAKKLASTVGDSKPASGEAQALLRNASAIRAAASGRALSPAAQTAWGSVESSLDKIAQAFGLPARLP